MRAGSKRTSKQTAGRGPGRTHEFTRWLPTGTWALDAEQKVHEPPLLIRVLYGASTPWRLVVAPTLKPPSSANEVLYGTAQVSGRGVV